MKNRKIDPGFFYTLSFFLFIGMRAGLGLASEDTVINGGKMELINKGAEVVFSKGVKMVQGTDELTAKEMRTTNNRDKITATGDVQLFRKVSSTETWRGTGAKGFYDTNAGTGYLLGGSERAFISKTEIISSTSSRVIEIWGDRIDFMRVSKMANATGHVQGKTTDPQTLDQYEFFSQNAVYDGKSRILVLSGEKNSRIRQIGKTNKRDVWGRVITYYVDSGRLVSDGEARAVMENEKEGKQ